MATKKGFIKDFYGNKLLPITRGELILDENGQIALFSDLFAATTEHAGLMTAAEKAMLNGGSGNSLADVYTKLGDINTKLENINESLQVDETYLSFFNAEGKTPIKILGVDELVSVTTTNNNIIIGLAEIGELSATNFLKSINVDKYGRVTAVSGSALTSDEIPETLSGKNFNNCSVVKSDNSTSPIASEDYVNEKISEVNSIATGALVFGGLIGSNNEALEGLENENRYYKVNVSFEINKAYLSDPNNVPQWLKIGDTLIVLDGKFVYIPSGDEIQTTLTIKQGDDKKLNSALGDITLDFAGPFVVEGNDKSANISISQANGSTNGYLSSSDWNKFNNYENNLKVEYTQVDNITAGQYTIGQINIGGVPIDIKGHNSISSLSLEQSNLDTNLNPKLHFTESGVADVDIILQGKNGIVVGKNGNSVEFSANNEISTGSENYLSITNGYLFGAKIGEINNSFEVTTDGLASVSLVREMIISYATHYEIIDYSLSTEGTSTSEYRYGNDKLKEAISVTI